MGRLFQRGRINYAADGELGGKLAGCWPADDGDKVHLKLARWILCATSKLTFPLDQSWLLPRWYRRGVDGLEGGCAGGRESLETVMSAQAGWQVGFSPALWMPCVSLLLLPALRVRTICPCGVYV